jgi:hypothetical protein
MLQQWFLCLVCWAALSILCFVTSIIVDDLEAAYHQARDVLPDGVCRHC